MTKLTWTASPAADDYVVTAFGEGKPAQILPEDAVTITDTGTPEAPVRTATVDVTPDPEIDLTVYVQGHNSQGLGAPASVVVPAQPIETPVENDLVLAYQVTDEAGQVTLTLSTAQTFTSYGLMFSVTFADGRDKLDGEHPDQTFPMTWSAIPEGETITFRVRATNEAGDQFSNTVVVVGPTAAPPAPVTGSLTVTRSGDTLTFEIADQRADTLRWGGYTLYARSPGDVEFGAQGTDRGFVKASDFPYTPPSDEFTRPGSGYVGWGAYALHTDEPADVFFTAPAPEDAAAEPYVETPVTFLDRAFGEWSQGATTWNHVSNTDGVGLLVFAFRYGSPAVTATVDGAEATLLGTSDVSGTGQRAIDVFYTTLATAGEHAIVINGSSSAAGGTSISLIGNSTTPVLAQADNGTGMNRLSSTHEIDGDDTTGLVQAALGRTTARLFPMPPSSTSFVGGDGNNIQSAVSLYQGVRSAGVQFSEGQDGDALAMVSVTFTVPAADGGPN